MTTVGFSVGTGANPLDLTSLLIKRPSSTFFWVVDNDSTRRFGLERGDLLIVDRSERIRPDSLLLVTQGGNNIIRRPAFNSAKEAEEAQLWGVITSIVRPLDSVIRHQVQPARLEG